MESFSGVTEGGHRGQTAPLKLFTGKIKKSPGKMKGGEKGKKGKGGREKEKGREKRKRRKGRKGGKRGKGEEERGERRK